MEVNWRMFMKKIMMLIIISFFSSLCFAAGPKYFSVLPFSVHGPTEYRYLSQGIQSMLFTRLNTPSLLEPVELKNIDLNISKSKLLKNNGLNFLIWGDVTVLGDNLSIDTKILNNKGNIFTKNLSTSQEKLIHDFDRFVENLKNQLLGIKPKKQTPTQNVPSASSSPAEPKINPYFEYSAGSSRKRGFIRTQSLPYEMVGLAIGDGNGDGKNEVFILSNHRIYAYIMKENKLKQLGEYEIGKNKQGLNINVMDSNRDGYAEIFISAVDTEGTPCSMVLSFENNKFQTIEDRLKFYINVKRLPPDYSKRIVGQRAGIGKVFSPGVFEVVKMSGEYRLGVKINLPKGSNVFNFAYLPEENSYKIITVDSYDHLRVFSDDLTLLYKTDITYAGSSVNLSMPNSMPGLGNSPTDPKQMYYIPTRLFPCDLEGDGRFELIVAHNMSISSMFFSRYRDFPEGQIHALFWDGVGLNVFWKTKTIKGSVMDYGIGDINNDSKNELYVGINTHPGPIGWKKKRTIVLIYPLKKQH
jgi:hypothetical protein